MKKIMTKVLSIVMAAAMCIGLVGTAMADSTTIEGATSSDDRGTITISGVEEGLTVNAYQIAVGEYDTTGVGEFTGYKMLYTTTNGLTIDKYGNCTPEEGDLQETDLSEIFNEIYDAGATVYKNVDADFTGTATFTDMEVGAYLFVVTGSESVVYNMVIGSVYYEADDSGNWAINNGSVNVKGTNNWVKASTPSIKKVENGGSLTDSDDYEHAGSSDLGDTLEYHITVGPIPSYEGEYPEFYVTDTISSNLTITVEEFDAMTITIGDVTLEKGTDYTATQTTDGFIVNFVVEGSYTLNQYVGQSLLIDFSADVTSAGFDTNDDADDPNEAVLTYATTSYVLNGDDGYYEGTDEDIDHDYTFNVKIQKVDQDEEALAGATFTLYTDSDCTNVYSQDGGETAVTATSGEDGYFEFKGLQEGTYYMKETTAPTGYALNTNIYKIDIEATYTGESDDHQELDTFTITVTDVTNNTVVGSAIVSNSTAKIENIVLGTLPSMGGTGIALCVIAGCVVLGVAIVGVTVYRRKNNVEV